MANSLIVIGSNSPGIKNIIKHGTNGFLFENKNPAALAKTLVTVIRMPDDELSRVRDNAKSFIDDNYNYDKMIQQYKTIIDRL